MKQIIKKLIKAIIIIIAIFGVLVYLLNRTFFDIRGVKGQEYLTESTSPNKTYTVTAYLNNGGATTSYAVLCVLKNNNTRKKKNIYWQYRCETADMEWLDDETIIINGIKLNVKKDVYDFRKD